MTICHLRPPEGDILYSSQVLVFKLVFLSDHSSPSGPEGELPGLGDLGSDRRPSGMLAFLRWSPANELGSISEGGSLSEGPITNTLNRAGQIR